ncbi:MAG: sigma-54 dependent transcriptional regulator, partial [Acidobacteriia bacterium]|nr:sigma-54 dependent transcriptional regulator [Terriglobia bacterium]
MPAGSKILIVDEQAEACSLLSEYMGREGLTAVIAHTGEAGLEKIRSEEPDTLILASRLPDMDGMQALKAAKALDEDLPVILMTHTPEIRAAVAAMRAGAHDYLEKPLKHHEVLRVVFRALNERSLKRKLRCLSSQVEEGASLRESMGPSSVIDHLASEVARVAKTNFSVLILGETGTGKELVARATHALSFRSQNPLLTVDCGAIPETLLDSELFGHEKGAYTGADQRRIGKFEMASSGTFFLDEISNMPLGSQAKLLRVLQERTICRIGGTQPIRVDVRVLAASNQDLHQLAESKEGLFRRDVYFRLNEFAINIPPLRERREDILYLAQRFLNLANAELQKKVESFTQAAADALLAYHWPGNVRELRSMIRRAVLLADDTISERHLAIPNAPPQPAANTQNDAGDAAAVQKPWNGLSLRDIVQQRTAALEREILLRVLRETGGNKARASRLLHIDYKTIHLKLKEYGI